MAAEKEEDVSPAEDLMREHGVLKRVLPIYREAIRRLDSHEELPPEVLAASAKLIRGFVEDTGATLHLANATALEDVVQRMKLRESLLQFTRMYEPHEAREDTVLFPVFHELVSKHEYGALGEDFEKKENQLFGVGIYELAQLTPR